ncbi:MAG: hypothetical protein JWP35_3155 [Caulobacter sp.]|nr:hypothetical protein [Caulobacter sp.]
MQARVSTLAAWFAGLGFLLLIVFAASPAAAQCCAPPTPPNPCNCTPPPCCTPPTPPPPPTTNCCTPSHNVFVPGVNVYVGAQVNVVVKAQAQAQAGAAAGGTVFVGGGGGGGGYVGAGATGVIQGLNVEGAMRARQVSYQATRSRYLKVVIQAFCLDDRDVPHPASQVSPDREIDDAYDGELYRCIAGTRMQYTWSEYKGQIDFTGGRTVVCGKGEALYHAYGAAALAGGPNGGQGGAQLVCKPQKPARDCNERSLLRRFGAGVKVLTIVIVETYTAYREERTQESSSSMTTMSLDGGVGGIVY